MRGSLQLVEFITGTKHRRHEGKFSADIPASAKGGSFFGDGDCAFKPEGCDVVVVGPFAFSGSAPEAPTSTELLVVLPIA
jgi:hypothetical protein